MPGQEAARGSLFPILKGPTRVWPFTNFFSPIPSESSMVSGIGIYRFAGGKIEENWSNWDALGLLQQLGAIPAPEQAVT